jgi:hypothetical protein
MIIQNSAVTMASSHELLQRYQKQEKLTVWKGERPPSSNGAVGPPSGRGVTASGRRGEQGAGRGMGMMGLFPFPDRVTLSPQVQEIANALGVGEKVEASEEVESLEEVQATAMEEMEIQLLTMMLESLTGKRIHFARPLSLLDELEGKEAELQERFADLHEAVHAYEQAGQNGPPPKQGWGLEYDSVETTFESEQTHFAAQGEVTTTDGRTIDFSVDMSMSRTFMERNEIHVRAGDAKLVDPLVVNFGGSAAQLTRTHFEFDLDSDGSDDQVSFVTSGSGLLALDKNGDGAINNGSELFGPNSGNGFSELAQHDSDGNGWIDEADPIFDRLRIWTKDANGQDRLFALGEKGVGALYLGNVSTPFSIKDQSNQLLGQVQGSGVFLKEDGGVGTLQQVDLAVRPTEDSAQQPDKSEDVTDPGTSMKDAVVRGVIPRLDVSV